MRGWRRAGYLFSERKKTRKSKRGNCNQKEVKPEIEEKGFCKNSRVKEMFSEIKQ